MSLRIAISSAKMFLKLKIIYRRIDIPIAVKTIRPSCFTFKNKNISLRESVEYEFFLDRCIWKLKIEIKNDHFLPSSLKKTL